MKSYLDTLQKLNEFLYNTPVKPKVYAEGLRLLKAGHEEAEHVFWRGSSSALSALSLAAQKCQEFMCTHGPASSPTPNPSI